MLVVDVPITDEGWDEQKECFVESEIFELRLEHSLLAIAGWEAKYKKVFFSKNEKTSDEIRGYIRFMAIDKNVPETVFGRLSEQNIIAIRDYMDDSQTATHFRKGEESGSKKRSKEPITSDLIYYWLVACQIPFECQTWHINRLLTLVRIYELKNQKPKKHSKNELLKNNAALNKAQRERFHTSG